MAVVGITADRRADEQALMFTRLGIDVVLAPALATVMETEDGRLRDITEALIQSPPDDVVANTGIGMRTWFAAAAGWGLDAPLFAALDQARIVARGPKSAAAVRSAGLELAWRAESEQLAEVARHLVGLGVAGHRVAVQRHGRDDEALAAALVAAGAAVIDVPVYHWQVPEDHAPAIDLVERISDGTVDAVTFTAAPAVRNLMGLARTVGQGASVLEAFNTGTVLAACVGPVCAGSAKEEGIERSLVPEHWRLGSLVKLVAGALGYTES